MAFGEDSPRNAAPYNRRKPATTGGKMGIVGLIAIITILALVAWLGPPLIALL